MERESTPPPPTTSAAPVTELASAETNTPPPLVSQPLLAPSVVDELIHPVIDAIEPSSAFVNRLKSRYGILSCVLLAMAMGWLLVWAGWGRGSTVHRGPGRLVNVAIEVQNRLKERHIEAVPVAFPYCHLAQGSPDTDAWIHAQRRVNQEDARLVDPDDRLWRDHRCLSSFDDETTFARIDATFAIYLNAGFRDILSRAIYNTPNLSASGGLRPRCGEVFIDGSGQLYYRVLMASPALGHEELPQTAQAAAQIASAATTRLVSVLVSHTELRETLNAWARDVINTIGPLNAHPCICPAHFGMVGSGLYFTTDEVVCVPLGRSPSNGPWHIWADFHMDHVTEAEGQRKTDQSFRAGWHRFPALVDANLWPRDSPVISVAVAAHYRGHDMEVLYQRDRVEQLDPRSADEHWIPPPSPSLAAAANEDSSIPPFHASTTRNTYLLRLTFNETRSLTSRSCKPTTVDSLAFNACYGYCTMLDRRLLALSTTTTTTTTTPPS